MLMFTDRGPRHIDTRDVIHVYHGHDLDHYVQATVVMANGEEISGMVLAEALAKLEAQLPDEAA
jgi:hypothetical protein